ncbi:hypothetical protein [Sphingomonas crocodyli]|uniref:Uncharacterized protein n=1 Tax=Sphingomonas crocodyli TaxID=1979270 RepID=A0A437M6K8_9SPHN|nr:hypothetical protein [Sphingomonas crocodyli]RVT93223.1 hypothetical protein EOD43_04870 [Sphingomonas crocodyli]
MLRRYQLAEWYWIAVATWGVVFFSLTAIISFGAWINPLPLLWLLLTGWPEHDWFAAVLRPLRVIAPAPLVLLPFAIKARSIDG